MAFLTDIEADAIAARIREIETGTSVEIVTVVAPASDSYRYIPTLWAALIALLVPGLVELYWLLGGDTWSSGAVDRLTPGAIYMIQVTVFLALGMLFQWPPLRTVLVPRAVRQRRAASLAHQQFIAQGLHTTEQRTGLMLFVSVAEHHVEIIADKGLAEVVDNAVWEQAVAEFIAEVRAGRIAEGFQRALAHCADITHMHFPATGRNPDELPNHLVLLDAPDL